MATTLREFIDQAKATNAAKKQTAAQTAGKNKTNTLQNNYTPSETVNTAYNNLNSLQKPGEYQSNWQTQLNDTINKILNREKFSYDLNGDALYQQYKDQYVTQGQQAMMDTMGQAAALTGGYGNSYAQTVGQQTYQGYLQQLNDKIPELYQLALDQYIREGEDLYNQYGLFADRDNTDYGRYRDTVSDYYNDRDYYANMYLSERDFDYGDFRNMIADDKWQTEFDRAKLESDRAYERGVLESDRAYERGVLESDRDYQLNLDQFDWGKYVDNQNLSGNAEDRAYGKQQDAYNNLVSLITTTGYVPSTEELTASGMSKAQAQAYLNYYNMQKAATTAKSSGGSSGSSGSGGTKKANTTKTPDPTPDPEPEIDVEDELNDLIRNGASKSEINNYLREALKSGVITQAQYNSYKNTYAPRGNTY